MVDRIWLYHEKQPSGETFPDYKVRAMLNAGWVDTPAKLENQPKNANPNGLLPAGSGSPYTDEQVANANAESLISMVTSMGFIVMTREQLEAELQKRIHKIKKSVDEEIEKAKKSESKKSEVVKARSDALLNEYLADKESLNKSQLKLLAQGKFGITVKGNPNEKTLKRLIEEAIALSDEVA